jgi:hypothetical protein
MKEGGLYMKNRRSHEKTIYYHYKTECEIAYNGNYEEEQEICQKTKANDEAAEIDTMYPLKRISH